MIIEKNVTPFVILSQASISDALRKISENLIHFVFCINEHGILEGILSNGDFLRWVVNQSQVDLRHQCTPELALRCILVRDFWQIDRTDHPCHVLFTEANGVLRHVLRIVDEYRARFPVEQFECGDEHTTLKGRVVWHAKRPPEFERHPECSRWIGFLCVDSDQADLCRRQPLFLENNA